MAVAAGDRIAADGVIENGTSDVDRSIVTGESAPESIAPGSEVQAGTLNLTGPLTGTHHRSWRRHIPLRAHPADGGSRAGRSRVMCGLPIDWHAIIRLRSTYSPAPTLIGWLLLGHDWHDSLMAAVAVLIITCPCALGLAIPAVQVVASGVLFRRGVMIKNGAALGKDGRDRHSRFRQDGNAHAGQSGDGRAPGSLGRNARRSPSGLAQESRHPLSRALVAAARARGIAPEKLGSIAEYPGLGLMGVWRGQSVRLGSRAWCGFADVTDDEGLLEIVFRVGDGAPVTFTFEDMLRPDADTVVASLRREGIKVEMLSGDRPAAVARAARALDLDSLSFAHVTSGETRPRRGVGKLTEERYWWSVTASMMLRHLLPALRRWRLRLPAISAVPPPMSSSWAVRLNRSRWSARSPLPPSQSLGKTWLSQSAIISLPCRSPCLGWLHH